jgi:hypothetical protein
MPRPIKVEIKTAPSGKEKKQESPVKNGQVIMTEKEYLAQLWEQQRQAAAIQKQQNDKAKKEEIEEIRKHQAEERELLGLRSSRRLASQRDGTSGVGTHLNEFELNVACGMVNETRKKKKKPSENAPAPTSPAKDALPPAEAQPEPRREPAWEEQYESLVRFKARCDMLPSSGHLLAGEAKGEKIARG